jgi:ubiquinone/menaquinone biosynthesis C-methylase UbiE
MQDIHHGFQNISSGTDARALFEFLDAADGVESIQAYRRRMLELCPPVPGQRILDVGCGIGHSTLQLAPLVATSGCVVGVDKSEPLIVEARRRAAESDAPVEYQVCDAQHLDFACEGFDACRTERMLMYVQQPQQAVNEMLRVLRPGGMFAFFEFDYEGIVVDAPDRAFTRKVVRVITDSVPSPWIGRRLPRLLRERGVEAMTVIPHMILTPYTMYRRVIGGTIAQAVQAGQFDAMEISMWWQALEQAEIAGHFFAGFPGFLVCGRTRELADEMQTPAHKQRRLTGRPQGGSRLRPAGEGG